ncbi:MAG: adenylate/guanylate cyclase domain-containing protein [Acidimicrobiales bacterium]
MTTPEEYEAAGLLDLNSGSDAEAESGAESDGRQARLELLQWLEEQGFSLAEMVDASARLALAALPGDRRLVPGERLTRAQALEISGLTSDKFETIATGFGFTPWLDRSQSTTEKTVKLGLTKSEVEALALFDGLAAVFSEDEALGFIRVVGSSLGRIAEAALSLFMTDVEGPLIASAATELEIGRRLLETIELLDDFLPLLDPILRRHLQQAIDRSRLSIIDETERRQYRYAVGFVDLVGFTPISHGMTPRQLAAFLHEFEGRAHDAVTAVGARLVKFIGDEVMFVAPDADGACRVAQTLMTEFATENDGAVVPRGGLAYGDVLVRGGDYYGEVVNLASRLAGAAAPSELLVSDSFAAETAQLGFEPAGQRNLKGFADPVQVQSVQFLGSSISRP